MPHTFVSYSREDNKLAEHLVQLLQENGFEVWFDTKSLRGGTAWRGELVNAIKSCGVFLVLLTPSSVNSSNVIKELTLAESFGCNIIPLELGDPQIPPRMLYQIVELQRIRFTRFDDATRAHLLEALRRFAPQPSTPAGAAATPPPPAPRPEAEPSPPPAAPSDSGQRADASPALPPALLEVVKKYQSALGIYLAPAIPEGKLRNVHRVGDIPNDEPIIALIDLTVWGSAKNFLALTSRGVYFRSGMFSEPGRLTWSEYHAVDIKEAQDFGGVFFGTQGLNAGSRGAKEFVQFCLELKEALA